MTRIYKHPFPDGSHVKVEMSLKGDHFTYSVKWSKPPSKEKLDRYFEWRPSIVKDFGNATGLLIEMKD